MVEMKGSFDVIPHGTGKGGYVPCSVLFLNDGMLFVYRPRSSSLTGVLEFGLMVALGVVGGEFAGVMGFVVGGFAGVGVGVLIDKGLRKPRSSKGEMKVKSYGEMSVSEILLLNKSNFEILYDDVSRVDFKGYTFHLGKFVIEGKRNEKFKIGAK